MLCPTRLVSRLVPLRRKECFSCAAPAPSAWVYARLTVSSSLRADLLATGDVGEVPGHTERLKVQLFGRVAQECSSLPEVDTFGVVSGRLIGRRRSRRSRSPTVSCPRIGLWRNQFRWYCRQL